MSDLLGSYSPTKVQPRNLPSDDVIATCFDKINNSQWQWIYGVIAAYGLKIHVSRVQVSFLASQSPHKVEGFFLGKVRAMQLIKM
ncbi:hypothetical protein QUA71_07010 [Microcoleus sp. MON1_C5]|uniref:hypothetical protein n=1 Tax=Microcoleus sp. MON1_C5 TaxID=2818828 RepID=UPI002FD736A7